MSRERRQHHRVNVEWSARLGRRGLGVAHARVRDASLSGVYVETTLDVEEGDHVLLEIQAGPTPATEPMLTEGLIMRKQSIANGAARGYGIQFTRINENSLQHLLELLAQNWSAR